MQHNIISYFDGSQQLLGELFYESSNNTKKPGVILFPAFEGIAEFSREYARQLAKQGYIVFVADMYGDAQSSDTIQGCFELVMPLLNDRLAVRRRALLAFETLMQQAHVDNKHIGSVGFCFGGMCMLELARSGAALTCGIGLHAVLAKSDLPTENIHTNLLLLQGYQDPQVPPSSITEFAEEMTQAKTADWTFVFFGQGKHSYTDPRTGTFEPLREREMGREYNKVIADRAYTYVSAFFKEQFSQ
jgi:dienelactone hydrolase